jgi:AraC family ethanolamine operon transcriptional activator
MRDAAALRVRCFSDDEASVQRIPGWNLHCLQVSAGVLAGQSVDLHLPSIQLLFEEYRNVRTGHSGTAPRGAVIFGVARAMQGRGLLNGTPWSDGVTAFDARQELVSIVPPVELISLVVDRRMLNEYAWTTEHVDLEHWLSQGPIVLSDADLAQRVAARLLEVKTACQDGSLCAEEPAAQQRLEDDILEILCPLVVERLRRPESEKRDLAHMEVVRRAREYVRERTDEPPRILDLCQALGVSRRWLQWSFNEVMGIGPWAYLHTMRLNGARRMLLSAAPQTKVKDVVEAYGFWHLSRFSRDYRRHFGELPSQTLHRSLARR